MLIKNEATSSDRYHYGHRYARTDVFAASFPDGEYDCSTRRWPTTGSSGWMTTTPTLARYDLTSIGTVDSHARLALLERVLFCTVQSVVKKYLGHLPGEIMVVHFDGMGPTWTQLVERGIEKYPEATHGIIADANFTPINGFDKRQLDRRCQKPHVHHHDRRHRKGRSQHRGCVQRGRRAQRLREAVAKG